MNLSEGSKIKFNLYYAPFAKGIGTIKNIYSGVGVQRVYSVEIEEVQGHYIYSAGDVIFIFPQEIEKKINF